MWNSEAVRAYESGQKVVLVQEPYPHYEPLHPSNTVESPAVKETQDKWVGLSLKDIPDKWLGNRQFIAGARWAAKYLKEKNA